MHIDGICSLIENAVDPIFYYNPLMGGLNVNITGTLVEGVDNG